MNSIAKGIPHMSLDIDEGVTSAPFRPKQGHSCCGGCCCGGCCDVRRAVVVLCILSIVGNFIVLISSDVMKTFVNGTATSFSFDDDSLNQAKDQTVESANSGINQVMILLSIAIICASSSMVGAIIFNKYLVLVNAIYLTVSILVSIFTTPSLAILVVNGLWLYPHIFLLIYIHNGIMSKENYPFEAQSCCCNSPV